jgi:uncharacterized protein involved in cysteine biosynthesis
MILADFLKAVGQLSDPRFRKVFWLGIALTLALLVAVYAILLWVIEALTRGPIFLPGGREITWIGDLLSLGSIFLMIFLSIFLMVPVASAITSLFLDDVAQAVEDRHYPGLPPVPRLPWSDVINDTAAFLALLIGANIVALVFFVLLPFAGPFIFYGVNGLLLGREYFQIAAMRREGRKGAKALRDRNTGTIWIAGCLMALPLTIPIVNLLVPILGAATFTHLYHRLKTR